MHSILARRLRYATPMLLWMLIIFSLSTDVSSAEKTRPAIGGLVRQLFPGLAQRLSLAMLERIDWNVRKAAHVSEYALLAILAYRAVTAGDPTFRNRNVILPFVISVLYAASDEYHQSFYASRGAKAADVTFDTFGVTLGLLLCLWHRSAKQSGEAK